MAEVPVYFFTGFMDSGKTSLIQQTLNQNGFAEDLDSILIISLEDGDEEYDLAEMDKIHAKVVNLGEDTFNLDNLEKLDKEYLPDSVFIEYNGTWDPEKVYEEGFLPKDWMIVQSLATVDATTFDMYLLNMRQMMVNQLKKAEVVIFNRCTDDTPRAKFRTGIKAFNRPAQIAYEREDGTIDDRPDELPFDISKDEIEISDSDYAIWFTDVMDNPKKYDGKIVSFLALVYNPKDGDGKLKSGTIVPGRFAMTCCVEDITFLGLKCKYKDSDKIGHKSWIHLRAKVKNEFSREYKGKGPVLYPVSIEEADKPEDELVYFN